MKAGTKRRCIILVAITVLIIWGNSSLSSHDSYVLSSYFSNLLTKLHLTGLVRWLSFLGKSQGSQVRKGAHLFEFAVYGFMIRCFLWNWKANTTVKTLSMVLVGMSTALIDETIQLFTNRTSSVKDIWIDLAGYSVGIAVSTVIMLLYYRTRRNDSTSIEA